MAFLSIAAFLFALHPVTSFVFLGFDGPVRVLLFVAGCLTVPHSRTALRPQQYWGPGLWAILALLAFLFAALLKTIYVNGMVPLGAVATFGSFIIVVALGLSFTEHDFHRTLMNIRWALTVGGVATAAYLFMLAIQEGTIFVGLIRYSREGFNLNHYATYLGFALLAIPRPRTAQPERIALYVLFVAVVGGGLAMLVSRTALAAVVLTLVVWLLARQYRLVTGIALVGWTAIFFALTQLSVIYETFGPVLDLYSSERGLIWYYASDGGQFSLISSLYEMEEVFAARVGAARDPTAYTHNTLMYLFLNVGLVGAALFLVLVIMSLYRGLKLRDDRRRAAVLLLAYLTILGLGEEPLEFRKFGTAILFIIVGLVTFRLRPQQTTDVPPSGVPVN